MTIKFKRPEIPYNPVQPLARSTVYKDLTMLRKPISDDMLDGEMNYVIDSLNTVSDDIDDITANGIPGIKDGSNINKVPLTNGSALVWDQIGSLHIKQASIQASHMTNDSVMNKHIVNDEITSDKIKRNNNTVGFEKKWANAIGASEQSVPDSIVTRDVNGDANFNTVSINTDIYTGDSALTKIPVFSDDSNLIKVMGITEFNKNLSDAIKVLSDRVDVIDIVMKTPYYNFNKVYPVGSIFLSNSAVLNPPYFDENINKGDQIVKIKWVVVEQGSIMTSGSEEDRVGKHLGTKDFSGLTISTDDFKLTKKEVPEHSHDLLCWQKTIAKRINPQFEIEDSSNILELVAGEKPTISSVQKSFITKEGGETVNTMQTHGEGGKHAHAINYKRYFVKYWIRSEDEVIDGDTVL